jgi:hypothetical protein
MPSSMPAEVLLLRCNAATISPKPAEVLVTSMLCWGSVGAGEVRGSLIPGIHLDLEVLCQLGSREGAGGTLRPVAAPECIPVCAPLLALLYGQNLSVLAHQVLDPAFVYPLSL